MAAASSRPPCPPIMLTCSRPRSRATSSRSCATQSTPHGASDNEQTWTEITTFGQIRESRRVDWATLGMIAEAVLGSATSPPA
jgi:hypothetical protein